MSGSPFGAPRFRQSTGVISGDVSISGSLSVTGSIYLSGSLIGGTGYYTTTTGSTRWFVDGTNGDNANDGLASNRAKKNFSAITSSIPYVINHNSCLHLTGTIADAGASTLYRYVNQGVTFLVDGGPEVTYELDDGAGGGIATTATSTGSLTVAGGTYSLDVYAGRYIKLANTVGAAQDDSLRLVLRNTDSTFVTSPGYGTDPGAGTTFKLCRPNTYFNGNAIRFGNDGPGTMYLQRFEWGANRFECYGNYGERLGGITLAGIYNRTSVQLGVPLKGKVSLTYQILDSSSIAFPVLSSSPSIYMGCSWFGYEGNPDLGVSYADGGELNIAYSYVGRLNVQGAKVFTFSGRCDRLHISDTSYAPVPYSTTSEVATISSVANAQAGLTMIGSGTCYPHTAGMTLLNSSVRIGNGVFFPQNTGHAIEARHSFLHLSGNMTGSGHTNFAIRAYENSTVLLGRNTSNAYSQLSGTKGYITVDGVTEATDFATVDGGTNYTDISDGTVIKRKITYGE